MKTKEQIKQRLKEIDEELFLEQEKKLSADNPWVNHLLSQSAALWWVIDHMMED